MEVFVIIVEQSGIYKFSGIGFNASEVKNQQKEFSHAMVLKEEIDEEKLVNDEIYVSASYDLSKEHPDYRGIYYSYGEARKVAGPNGNILPFHLPKSTALELEVY